MKLMYILGFDINIFGFDVSKYDIFLCQMNVFSLFLSIHAQTKAHSNVDFYFLIFLSDTLFECVRERIYQ